MRRGSVRGVVSLCQGENISMYLHTQFVTSNTSFNFDTQTMSDQATVVEEDVDLSAFPLLNLNQNIYNQLTPHTNDTNQ